MSYRKFKSSLDNYTSDVRIDKGDCQRSIGVTWLTFKRFCQDCEGLETERSSNNVTINGSALVRHLSKQGKVHYAGLILNYIEDHS